MATAYGKLLYTQLVDPLEKMENIEASFRTALTGQQLPVIRLGAVKEFFHSFSLKHLAQVPADLIISFGITKDLLDKLAAGDLDFVIATHRTERKDIFFEPILTESFIVAGSSSLDTTIFNGLIKRKEWGKAEEWLLEQTWFAYSPDLAIIRRFWLTNFKKRPAVKPRFTIPDMNTILEAIGKNGGVTVAADYLVKDLGKNGHIIELWKGITPTTNTIYLAYDKTKVSMKQIEMAHSLCVI